ncbi:MAG: tetratricopeptide repeat protein [Acidobacteriia bacterium]|nr:tetratricopeptide repeat protein [Terriglobia bacterium]
MAGSFFLSVCALLLATDGLAASLVCSFADEQGKALRNVAIQVVSAEGGEPRYQRSDKHGQAIFKSLKAGVYELRAQLKDHVPLRWEVTISEDKNLALTLMTGKGFETLDQEAGQAINNRDFNKAQGVLQKLVAAYPEDAVLHHGLGRAYAGQLQEDKALAEAEKAARLDSQYSDAKRITELFILRERGERALEGRDFAAAAEFFEKMIKLDPKDAEAYYGMALAYGHLENYQKALPAINRAVTLDPQNSAYLKVKEILEGNARAK